MIARTYEPTRSDTGLIAQQLAFMLLLMPASASVLMSIFGCWANLDLSDSRELVWSIGWGAAAADFIVCIGYAFILMRARHCLTALLLLVPSALFSGAMFLAVSL